MIIYDHFYDNLYEMISKFQVISKHHLIHSHNGLMNYCYCSPHL